MRQAKYEPRDKVEEFNYSDERKPLYSIKNADHKPVDFFSERKHVKYDLDNSAGADANF